MKGKQNILNYILVANADLGIVDWKFYLINLYVLSSE